MTNDKLIPYINLKLAALGCPVYVHAQDAELLDMAQPLLRNHQEKNRLLAGALCPVDRRIQDFLNDYLKDVPPQPVPRLPVNTFVLDHAGLARTLSLPPNKDSFVSEFVESFRVKQGVLHNPKYDRRTTEGVFHIAEGGFPIPDDKIAVPKEVFARLLAAAVAPPRELLRLPFTSAQEKQAEIFTSLLMRPIVCPAVPGLTSQKSLEIRFFAPGSLISNLDFVESIFGNAGDPYLLENDASLDVEHWTGNTGCVILAPHLIRLKKKQLGLPPYEKATKRQRRDGQCWKDEGELYNGGGAFKITARDERGVIVTIIADNYFGYCKKEVKTQISFSANLHGLAEEEHSGGALVFPTYMLGHEFDPKDIVIPSGRTIQEVAELLGDRVELKEDGYAVDKNYPHLIYVPEDAVFTAWKKCVTWTHKGKPRSIKLLPDRTYIMPSGYKVELKKQLGGRVWRLVGITSDGTLCHKPCTVSGGGKSEISKSLSNAMIQGPVFVKDFHKDMDEVDAILKRDFSNRFRMPREDAARMGRPILFPDRSLGSVIKLLTPSPEYTDEYNAWVAGIPQTIRQIIFVVKRYWRPEWGESWRRHFSVDLINGYPGHELKFDGQRLVGDYLRVGLEKDGSWRIFKLRPDFLAAEKVQVEDDITASIVVPREMLKGLNPAGIRPSVKLVLNCESRLFQRPDDAIIRGFDKQAEADLVRPGVFVSNFQPLTREDAQGIIDDISAFDQFTEPVKELLNGFVSEGTPEFVVCTDHPRLVNGKPSKNPRYLQERPDLVNEERTYLAEMGTRLARGVPVTEPLHFPVGAVLAGRRNNPPDPKINLPALAVYNPIHYQELPELFMDFISSLTGKSPSTTGFGSEGALTKRPFNALWPIVDLNNALTSFIVTGYAGFTTAAGYVGPYTRMDHDISLLVPEVWSRMAVAEREPQFLIQNGYLEKLEDFDHNGRKVLASRLGYRITARFCEAFLGRIFGSPNRIFAEEMLKPEKQSLKDFVEGIENIVADQERVAQHYFADGSVEAACPPLKALLHIMAAGTYEGKSINHPEIRALFDRDAVMKNPWYQERLKTQQERDAALWARHARRLEEFQRQSPDGLHIKERLVKVREQLSRIQSRDYLKKLSGTIGADPFTRQAQPYQAPALSGTGKADLV